MGGRLSVSGFLSAAPASLESPTCISCIPVWANGLSKEAETAGGPHRPLNVVPDNVLIIREIVYLLSPKSREGKY